MAKLGMVEPDGGASVNAARVAKTGQALCAAGAISGGIGLLGWTLGAAFLTNIVPGRPPMVSTTTLAPCLAGVAGALRHPGVSKRGWRALSTILAFVVLLLGAGTLAENVLAVDLHVDGFLFDHVDPSFSARATKTHLQLSSAPTGLALTLLAGALLLLDVRPAARARPSEWFILAAAITAFTMLMGRLFGAGMFHWLPPSPAIGVALPTSISLLLTSTGLLLERPTAGLMRLVTSGGPGGVLIRFLLIPSIAIPAALGVIVAKSFRAVGIEEFPAVIAMLDTVLMVVGLVVLSIAAVPLNRTHDALERSRSRARDLFDQASDGIFVADRDGRYIEVNAAGCRMVGYSREEILSKTIMDLIPKEDVGRLMRARQRLLEGDVQVGEWTLCRKDGTYLPVEVSAKILPDGRWEAFARDIAERKRADDEIRQVRERFELALRGANLAAWDWNVLTGEVVFNARWAEIRGFRPEQIMPHVFSWISGVHPEDLSRVMGALERHFRGLTPEYATEHRCRTKSGEWIWVLDQGKVFARDEAGRPTRMVGTELDITERKRFEEELRRSEANSKFLAEAGTIFGSTLEYEDTLSSVVELAVREFADFCIIDVVERAGEIRRSRVRSRDPSIAWACDLLLSAPPERDQENPICRALGTQQPVLVEHASPEMIASTANGPERFESLRTLHFESTIVAPLVTHGKAVGALTVVSLARSRAFGPAEMRLTQELAQRAALSIENARLYRAARQAIRARDDVLGVVAHDLRNPLSTILMQANLLRSRAGKNDDDAERPEAILRAANRMNRLIRDLLDLTSLEAGSLSVEKSRLSTSRILADSVETLRSQAASGSIELRLEVADDLPDVLADRDRLLQVFENLVGNAIKFTPGGGSVTLGAALRENEVQFRVTDTGIGVSAQDLAHVFDRFWQARKAERRGAGLGLPIVKGIVEAHGGRVWVESSPGRGTTFFFTIPAAPSIEDWRSEPAHRVQ